MKTKAKKPPYPGRLVAVEGLSGSGKSTQIRLLYEWLAGMNCRVFYSEWNSSEMVLEVRRRGKKLRLLTPTTFSIIHALDFADRYDHQILPMLKAGFIVLCDQYLFTPYALDRVRGCEAAWLRELYRFALLPHITIYLDLPLHLVMERIVDQRAEPGYFDAGMDLRLSGDIFESYRLFQGRVLDEYLSMAGEFDFKTVDATKKIPEMQQQIRQQISTALDLSQFKEGRQP